MRRMHIVKLRLKFEPQLDLLLVILVVLREVFLQLQPQRFLAHHFALELLAQLPLRVQVLLQHLLIVSLLFSLPLVVTVKTLNLFLVLPGNLADQHPVIRSAAVLKQDCEDL